MKKITFSLLILGLYLLAFPFCAKAIFVERQPVTRVQPNGDTVQFFVTGDEYYHRYHDADNYTLLMDTRGYWVYAQPVAKGGIEPSAHVYGTVDPASLGLTPGLTITQSEWIELQKAWELPADQRTPQIKTSGRNHGDYCNLVIFIRFAEDTGFRRSFASVDNMFSDSSSATANSMFNYFRHASYNKIYMRTYYAPAPLGNTIRSYRSVHSRNYFMPYSDSNPEGYSGRERSEREFDLLVAAVNYINDSFPVPQSYVLDCDNDGFIDNVNFIVIGAQAGWNDLLWPHKWDLAGRHVYINGKQVGTFNFQLEGSGSDYFGASTFSHEMFHSLGAPDLYRYNDNSNITPVGGWDLMASNSKPPQHMSAYMKYKYGNWLDSIPTLTEPGTYTLNALGDSTCDRCCYKVLSENPDQYYVLEYRDNTLAFETGVPGKGIVIFRIDTRFNGNAGYDDGGTFDEVWVCRPGSTSRYENGHLGQAAFSSNNHRTEFSPSSDPYPFQTDGTRDMNFTISHIGMAGNSITFHFDNKSTPTDLNATRITTRTATINWLGNGDAFMLRWRKVGTDDFWETRYTLHSTATILDLEPNTLYECAVMNVYSEDPYHYYTDHSDYSKVYTFQTESCNNPSHTVVGNSTNDKKNGFPFSTSQKYSYAQQIITLDEMGGEQNINTLSIHYAGTVTLNRSNCSIYLGHTSLDQFGSEDGAVPGTDLTLVFAGNLSFIEGWNDILLDTPFHYNGEENLVVAFDDNAGSASTVSNRFYVNTPNRYSSILYTSNNDNPDPSQDSLTGSKQRLSRRVNIQFAGCMSSSTQAYLCVIPDNGNLGRVSGDGYYPIGQTVNIQAYATSSNTFKYWHDGNTDNPRTVLLEHDTIFVAFFGSPAGIEESEEGAGYTLITQGLRLTVQGADAPVMVYDLMGRVIATHSTTNSQPTNVTFTLPHTGIYLVRIGENRPAKVFVYNN